MRPDELAAEPIASPAPGPAEPVVKALEWSPTHRHVKRGTTYRVIGEAEAQVSWGHWTSRPVTGEETERGLQDGDRLIVYQAEDGKLWARFSDEFNDGRFEAFTQPAPAPVAAQAETITKLTERCDAYKGQVEAGAAEIERLTKDVSDLEEEIGEHEAEGRRRDDDCAKAEARADALGARVAELEAALGAFEMHYPMGINCWLDDAARTARRLLQPKAPAPAGEGGGS